MGDITPATSTAPAVWEGVHLQQCALVFDHDIPYDQWEQIGERLRFFESNVHWWIGDWLNYGEKQYGDKYAQATENAETVGYTVQTLMDDAWVAGHVELSLRKESLSFSHHKEVASLEPSDQDTLLARAEEDGLSVRDLREAVRRYKHEVLTPAPALPTGKYAVIYADPPWPYDFAQDSSDAIEAHYPTMTIEEICALPIANLAADDAVLYLWATNPKLREALAVVEAWGFDYRTNACWDKEWIGPGYYVRQRHELLLIAKKGNLPCPEPSNRPPSVYQERRTEHSRKPDAYYSMIEAMYPGLPKVELFARRPRAGWANWGNEL